MEMKMAEDPATENARRQLEENNRIVEESRRQYAERMRGKPTPTQDENDRAALGEHVLEKEDDGSGPDPNNLPQNAPRRTAEEQKAAEARRPSATYQTRAATPQPPRPPST
jgi:hypothetical protein